MKKFWSLLAVTAILLLTLSACGDSGEKTNPTAIPPTVKAPVHVAVIKGPSGIGMTPLMEKQTTGTAENNYKFQVLSSPDEVVAALSKGEADIAALPSNLAATLYNKGTSGGIQLLAVTTKGVLSIVESGDTIHRVADLRGKTIYTTGEGANPEFILRHILTKNGLTPGTDVTISFAADNDELASKLAAGLIDVAMVPEPVTTTVLGKNTALRRALSMTEAWDALNGDSALLMTGIVVRTAFLVSHADAVRAFLAEYETSIDTVNTDIPTTARLCEKFEIIPSAAIAEHAIPGCNLTFLSGEDMRTAISGYYEVLFAADARSIGGALPKDDFYYAE